MRDYSEEYFRKRRRRRKRIFYIFGLILFIALVGSTIYGVLFTDVFLYKTIRVEGAVTVDKEAIFPSSARLYLFETPKITFPAVSSWTLEPNMWARELVIRVKERERFAVWCSMANANIPAAGDVTASTSTPLIIAQECFWFDRTGYLFEETPQTVGTLIKSVRDFSDRALAVGSYPLESPARENMFKIFEVTDLAGIPIVTFDLFSLQEQELIGESEAGARLEFSLRSDPGFAVEPLISLIPQLSKLEYIDLRSENKVYYK